MNAIQKIIFLSATVVLHSCGIKGPPLPPIEEETVQKQMATENQLASPESADASKATVKEKKKK